MYASPRLFKNFKYKLLVVIFKFCNFLIFAWRIFEEIGSMIYRADTLDTQIFTFYVIIIINK